MREELYIKKDSYDNKSLSNGKWPVMIECGLDKPNVSETEKQCSSTFLPITDTASSMHVVIPRRLTLHRKVRKEQRLQGAMCARMVTSPARDRYEVGVFMKSLLQSNFKGFQ